MTDEELNRKFDIVAQHLANLAVTQQQAEERMARGTDRLARAERILMLTIRAGRRERREWREKYAALVAAQMRTEEAMRQLGEAQKELTESQKHSDQRLDALIDIVREDRERRANGSGGPRGEGPDADR